MGFNGGIRYFLGFLRAVRGRGLEVRNTSPIPFTDGAVRQTITVYEIAWA